MPEYLNVVYNKKIKPYTDYPHQLCQHLFKRFNMREKDKLLDVGCGRGDFTKGFRDLDMEVFGIDIEKSSSELMKEINFKTVEVEKDSFPFADNSFDFIFSKSVIEHLWEPSHFIKECKRILKPNGTIILMTPDWHTQMYIFYNDSTHHHPHTLTSLRDLLKMYDFKEISSEVFYQLPVLWKYPWLKIVSRFLQFFGPVKKIYKNKFIRWSRELMILSSGIKQK